MAEDQESSEDRTEEATPERREEFREKGQVAVSREITSVFILAAAVGCLSFYAPFFLAGIKNMMIKQFNSIESLRITEANITEYAINLYKETLWMIIPIFLATMSVAIAATFFQTRFNFSWHRLKPDFARMNPLKGLWRMVSAQAALELTKGVGKMAAVGLVSYLILYAEWVKVPGLMNFHLNFAWAYWGEITQNLFWGVAILLIVVAALDYFYNFFSLEKKLKMTKKEVKEELKRREVDPHIKGRMRKMQRDIANRRMIENTKEATVIVTNPTHYSVALKYTLGMSAPKVVAKGLDFLALRMRETAKENDIPIVENRPLARTLYSMVEVGDEIPESLYKAVSEVIRYVFKLKGINLAREAGA